MQPKYQQLQEEAEVHLQAEVACQQPGEQQVAERLVAQPRARLSFPRRQ
jgi:hypothetical protein